MTYNINYTAPFWESMTEGTDLILVNNQEMPRAYWNLILSIRDCSLYSKGIKPHRFWKITDVKNYFGIKGNAELCKEQLEYIKLQLTNSDY